MRFLQLWLALVGIFLGGMWSSTAVAQSPLCRDVCPTLIARCIETECWLAPGEPERCEFWCELVGTCAVCGPCPVDDCNTVCNTAGAKCDTVSSATALVAPEPATDGLPVKR